MVGEIDPLAGVGLTINPAGRGPAEQTRRHGQQRAGHLVGRGAHGAAGWQAERATPQAPVFRVSVVRGLGSFMGGTAQQ